MMIEATAATCGLMDRPSTHRIVPMRSDITAPFGVRQRGPVRKRRYGNGPRRNQCPLRILCARLCAFSTFARSRRNPAPAITSVKAAAGFDPLAIDFSSGNTQRRQWNAWRTAVIADHVWRLRADIHGMRSGTAAIIPVLDEDWSDAAAREVLPSIQRAYPAITTLSWFAYGRWTPAALQRVERLSRL